MTADGVDGAMGRVLVTAATGAVARHLIAQLHRDGVMVTAAARGRIEGLPASVRTVAVGGVDGATNWREALEDVSHVVHLAALTRLDRTDAENQGEAAFDAVNRQGTRALAEQAAEAGIRRFVHISTAAVNGRVSGPAAILADGPDASAPAPASAYARSKLAAEAALWDIAARTGLEVAIVRPPRIIWPVLTGNLRLFERLISKGIPLPLGGIGGNARDNVSPDNLAAIIAACLASPRAPGHIFFATDADPLSTRALAERIGKRIGRRARLLPVPPALLRMVVATMPARLLGGLNRQEMISELLDDFRLDIGPTRELLGWQPKPGTL